jgi:hypothetical protein
MHRLTRTTALSALVAIAVTVAPTAASAAAPPADDPAVRLERACLRLPNLQTRTDNLIARLQADTDTRGSLAWLEAQIAQASERGRTDRAEALENRLAVRRATLDVMMDRAERIPELIETCAANGVAV